MVLIQNLLPGKVVYIYLMNNTGHRIELWGTLQHNSKIYLPPPSLWTTSYVIQLAHKTALLYHLCGTKHSRHLRRASWFCCLWPCCAVLHGFGWEMEHIKSVISTYQRRLVEMSYVPTAGVPNRGPTWRRYLRFPTHVSLQSCGVAVRGRNYDLHPHVPGSPCAIQRGSRVLYQPPFLHCVLCSRTRWSVAAGVSASFR